MKRSPCLYDDAHRIGRRRGSHGHHGHSRYRWSSPMGRPDSRLPITVLLEERATRRNLHAEGYKNTIVTVDKNYFQATIDIEEFRPEEVSVKLTDENIVIIEGKHEEREDEHGFISRQFLRKFKLPQDVDAKQLKSNLSTDGVLSVIAPKNKENDKVEYREIPVIRTGQQLRVEPMDASVEA